MRSNCCLNYTPASTLNAKRSQWKTGFAEDWEKVILISMQMRLDDDDVINEDDIQGDKVNSPGARGPLRPTGDDAVMVTADKKDNHLLMLTTILIRMQVLVFSNVD